MKRSKQITNRICGLDLCTTSAAIAFATSLLVAATQAQAQTFTVLHNFTGSDGSAPEATLTLDRAGNLYGTTIGGGRYNYGTVFKMTRRESGWALTSIYEFNNYPTGANPAAPVVFGPDGALYGSTHGGGSGPGVVFKLQPPAAFCPTVSCPWTETVLADFNFTHGTPSSPSGPLSFDAAGNIYGTSELGGDYNECLAGGLGCGTVYELTKSNSWAVTTLHAFTSGADGQYPGGGVVLDQAGNLYGTVPENDFQNDGGDVFELTPSGSGWAFNSLFQFSCDDDGCATSAGLLFDQAGNLYGATTHGGSGDGGTVFQLSPSGGSWNFNLLFSLTGSGGFDGPESALIMDTAGNLYGTTIADGSHGNGNVFKLTPSNGGYTYTSLHDFSGGSDGATPSGGLAMDASGNLYGTTVYGGSTGHGVVFEITP
ncbi:MAG: choice-of-anchor tandem repeat GloVer-containing protein [Candidatus Korobacteraceae bacterium]|jgi:uncharacterized repeat protein (TIGR03803 family)